MQQKTLDARYRATAVVTILGAVANIILSLIKCIAGWLGNSHALFADGMHSLSDLLADTIVLLASKFGNRAADKKYPYGHERIETAATIAVAGFLIFAALGIIVSGTKHIIDSGTNTYIHPYVLWIAVLALVINESIYWITLSVAKKIRSEMLIAHAWHRRSDAATSLIVLIGIIGSMLGIHYLDGVAAIVVGLFILRMGWKMGKNSFEELIDRGLDETELQKIKEAIRSIEGVRTLHQLRTRLMAGKIFADVHIIVDPFISVSEGHYIGDQVYLVLEKNFPTIEDITVHVDSENDEFDQNTRLMPSRKSVLKKLESLKQQLPEYEFLHLKNIHYLQNRLLLELAFPTSVLERNSLKSLEAAYFKVLKESFPESQVKIILV